MLSLGAGASIEKPSRYTRNGAVESELPILPGRPFPNPLPDYLVAGNISWQLDIWRQLRNARDVATLRSLATGEGRNYAVTRLVAEVADNYYELMALDRRLEILDVTIDLQEQSLKMARAKFDAGRGTELAVQRFVAEVAKNRSEKLIVKQEIIEAENRVNFRVGRFPQGVERSSMDYMKFVNLNLHPLAIGVPTHLLRNRPDIRQAERELEAAGLDILVARARFFPQPVITAGIGYEAFNPKYLFNTPEALIYNVAGNLVAPLINRRAIQADYNNANARQLQAIYNYQRVVLNAFTEVVNRVNMVENYRKSIELKKQQLAGLESAVAFATKLFNQARVEYIDVLFSLRDLQDAKMVITDTKRQQLSAIINTYQALGGGNLMPNSNPPPPEVHPIFK
jgi:outer membrane protein TolC